MRGPPFSRPWVARAGIVPWYARKGGFSPANLPGLALWLDASDLSTITHSSGSVSQWDDKSGNNRHVVQATASAQPATGTRSKNGLNTLDFDGNDSVFGSLTLAQPVTVLVVHARDSESRNSSRLLSAGGFTLQFGGGISANGSSDTDDGVWVFGGSFAALAGTELALGEYGVAVGVYNGTTTYGRFQGVQGADASAGTRSFEGTVQVGGSASVRFNGAIAELVICAGALATSDIEAGEAYLAAKWGITL